VVIYDGRGLPLLDNARRQVPSGRLAADVLDVHSLRSRCRVNETTQCDEGSASEIGYLDHGWALIKALLFHLLAEISFTG
jgi:hypothetical protein